MTTARTMTRLKIIQSRSVDNADIKTLGLHALRTCPSFLPEAAVVG